MSAGPTAIEPLEEQRAAREAWPSSMEWLVLGGALAFGVVLRVLGLRDQVLGDDEFHAVRAALEDPVSRILVTYRLQDHSIPLTLLYRLALDAGVRLGELQLRLPVVLAGVATLAVLPLWARRRVGAPVAAVFAWLLAISPMLVLYSRIVRSYAPVVLFGALAAGAFYEWMLRREAGGGARGRAAASYVGAAALAVWFHLGAAPFVVAPLVFGAVRSATLPDARERRAEFSRVAGLGVALGVVLGLFLWPARESLIELVRVKRVSSGVSPAVLLEWLQLQSGSRFFAGVLAFWGLAIAGVVRMARGGQRHLLAYLATLLTGHGLGLWMLSPEFRSVILLNRWMLIALPPLLLVVAHGLLTVSSGLAGPLRSRLAVGVLVLGLFVCGPFTRSDFWSSSFQHHYDWIRISREPARLDSRPPTPLVAALAALPPGAIVEYPWHPFWGLNRSFYAYQRQHGRRVLVSNDDRLARDRRLAWRNLVAPESSALLASGARLLVVHGDLPREEEAALQLGSERGRIATTDEPYQRMRRMAERRIPMLVRELGEPVLREEGLWIWDLAGAGSGSPR